MKGICVHRLLVVGLLLGFVANVQAGVGRTPGSPNVTATGDAGYAIPLRLPAGARGLTPQLALGYSSAVSQSIAGVGWYVAGVSAIARCASTVAQDGIARDVRLDASDRFCLDGQKLRLVTGTYGSANSEYRTEIETYARVTAYGVAGNGPAYFKVEGRDGLIYEYGNTLNSRIESLGTTTARAWALNHIADRQGNDIVFTYAEDASNGGYRLDLVSYTGNTALGVTAPYTVDLIYETKPVGEIDSGYVAGSLVKEITRLDRIDVVHSSGTLVRRYDLTYETTLSGSGRSRLASVQECAGSPLDCLPATSFVYQNGSIGLANEVSTGVTLPTSPWALDVNGDGREDLVYSSSATSGSGVWMVLFAEASGGYSAPVNTGIANTNYAGAITIDYNADGKGDLLVRYSGSTWWVMLGTTSGLATPTNTGAPVTATGTGDNARALDVDGDGLQDLVWADLVGYAGGDAIRYRLKVQGGAFSSTVQVLVGPLPGDEMIMGPVFSNWRGRTSGRPLDFNGDGRADFAIRHYRRFSTLLAPVGLAADGAAGGYNYVYRIEAICPGVGTVGAGAANAASEPYFGDFNGDGKTDLLYFDSTATWRYRFSTGKGFTAEQAGPNLTNYSVGWIIGDWDGDGYDDVLGPNTSSNTWYLMRSSGEVLAAPVSTGLPYVSGYFFLSDMNGDGLMDLVYRDGNGVLRYRVHTLDSSLPDLLTSATDGFGTTAAFTYLPITNSAVYTKGSGAVYPQVDVQLGRWVVNKLTASDLSGNDATYDQTFTYEAARKDLQGRGFLGYAKRTGVDNRVGYNLKTIETYRQDFPYIGALASLEQQQSSGTRIALTTNTWSNLLYGSGYAARSFPYVSSSTTDQHEVGGLSNGTRIRTITTAVAGTGGIDTQSGLVKDVTTTTTEVATGLNPASYKSERVQHTSVVNDTTYWCLGRPSATQVTSSHTLAAGGAVARSSDVTWDGAACRATQARLEPGNATLEARLDLGYDSFGNVSSQTVTGAGMIGRTTTTNWGTSGRFPLSTTNAANETTTQGWDLVLGLPGSVTDANGLMTSFGYDQHGRRTGETRPDGTSTIWTYSNCPTGCDSRVKFIVQQDQRDAGSATVRTDTQYFNRWEALAWERTQLLTTNDTAWTVRREFDSRGRTTREYVPYLTSGADQGYQSLSYDLLDRVTADSLYGAGGALDRATVYAYAGLQVTRTDPLNHSTTRATDAWGELLRLTDAANGQVNYQYDAFGQLKQATDAASNVVSAVTYNVRGQRTGLVDMDLGSWTFTPNALGEIVLQTDAKGQTTTFGYDALGRPTSRVEPDATSTWTWGNSAAAHNVGRLQAVVGMGYSESYTYDALGRPSSRTINSDASYQFDVTYNSLGTPESLTYPVSTAGVRVKMKYGYTGGVLSSIQDFTGNVNGPVLWNLNLLDARANAVSETYGNGLWLQNAFDPLTGEAKTRQAGTGGQTSNVQNLAYAWDQAGNLSNRQDLRQGLTESFTYDALDRLTNASGPGAQSLSVGYDALGNVTSRSDVGSYGYHAVRKHAVVSAGSNSYTYDANGNMSTRNGSTLTWTSDNLPASLSAGGYTASFNYAPDRSRWRQVSTYAGATETTIYVGGLLEKLTTSVRVHWKHRIPTPSGEVQVIRRSDGTNDVLYVTTDHLGSTEAVMDAAGAILVRESFGAWGARRGSNWSSGTPPDWTGIANTTRRGYTGHEHLDNLLLVHMNGRVYDPAIGRFLSADPYVGCLVSTQSWNRYAYVTNSPLGYTDPSGYMEEIIVSARAVNPGSGLGAFLEAGMGMSSSSGGMEEVVVTATRMYPNTRPPTPPMRSIPLPNSSTSTDPSQRANRQAGADHRKCIGECRGSLEPLVQMTAGIAGGAAGGFVAGTPAPGLGQLSAAAIGALVGGVTGLVTGSTANAGISNSQRFTVGTAAGIAAGANAALLQGGQRTASSIASAGIASGVGAIAPAGATGTVAGAAVGTALATGVVGVTAAAGIGTLIGWQFGDLAANSICSAMCGN